jgi:hypothetical protein
VPGAEYVPLAGNSTRHWKHGRPVAIRRVSESKALGMREERYLGWRRRLVNSVFRYYICIGFMLWVTFLRNHVFSSRKTSGCIRTQCWTRWSNVRISTATNDLRGRHSREQRRVERRRAHRTRADGASIVAPRGLTSNRTDGRTIPRR